MNLLTPLKMCGLISVLSILGCKTGEQENPIKKTGLIGVYKGTYFTCGKLECKTLDVEFEIATNDSKTYLLFDTIHQEIEINSYSKSIYSAEKLWNSSGTSYTHGFSGTYDEHGVSIRFSNKYLEPDVYQNELLGKLQD